MIERIKAAIKAFKNPRIVREGEYVLGSIEMMDESNFAFLYKGRFEGHETARIRWLAYGDKERLRKFFNF